MNWLQVINFLFCYTLIMCRSIRVLENPECDILSAELRLNTCFISPYIHTQCSHLLCQFEAWLNVNFALAFWVEAQHTFHHLHTWNERRADLLTQVVLFLRSIMYHILYNYISYIFDSYTNYFIHSIYVNYWWPHWTLGKVWGSHQCLSLS